MEKFIIPHEDNEIITPEVEAGPNPEINSFFQNLGKEKTVLLLSSFKKEALDTIKELIQNGKEDEALAILTQKKAELDQYAGKEE